MKGYQKEISNFKSKLPSVRRRDLNTKSVPRVTEKHRNNSYTRRSHVHVTYHVYRTKENVKKNKILTRTYTQKGYLSGTVNDYI